MTARGGVAAARRAETSRRPTCRAGRRPVAGRSARRRVTLDGELVDLTESEFRLLQALARFPGRVYTRSELVERLQGMEFEPYERTIDAHIKNLRRKLGDDARAPRLVLTVYGRGYAFAEDQRYASSQRGGQITPQSWPPFPARLPPSRHRGAATWSG
jgi:DNA-binding response OmpR family regulator